MGNSDRCPIIQMCKLQQKKFITLDTDLISAELFKSSTALGQKTFGLQTLGRQNVLPTNSFAILSNVCNKLECLSLASLSSLVLGILKGKYDCNIDLLFDSFGISCVTTDNFCFYLQNRLIQTSQTGGQRYIDTSPFSIPCLG